MLPNTSSSGGARSTHWPSGCWRSVAWTERRSHGLLKPQGRTKMGFSSTNGDGSNRAILYARVSTEEQMKGYSIPDQLRELRAYAACEGGQTLLGALSGGILRCDECGHTLRPNSAHKKKSGGRFHYYSCRSRYNTGPSRDCSNRKFLRAEQIEEQVWGFVRGLLRDPKRIRAGIDRLIEEERTDAGRDPGRDAEFWSRKMTEVEVERRGYHRLAAKGHMTDEELAAALSELDEVRETA